MERDKNIALYAPSYKPEVSGAHHHIYSSIICIHLTIYPSIYPSSIYLSIYPYFPLYLTPEGKVLHARSQIFSQPIRKRNGWIISPKVKFNNISVYALIVIMMGMMMMLMTMMMMMMMLMMVMI